MTSGRGSLDASFRVATGDQVTDVLDTLNEAAPWLSERGIEQWPPRFEQSWLSEAIARGETWLVDADGRVRGTVTVDFSDPLWADVDGSAAYIHRMAISRRERGLGAVILTWAKELALQLGREALRLDCVASNRGLRSYYEAAGFTYRDDVAVRGNPGQRLDDGLVTMVSRYEMQLGPRPR